MRPLLYVTAPWRTRTPDEAAATDAAIRGALELGYFPVFSPYCLAPTGLRDDVPAERELVLEADLALLDRCDAVLLVGGRLTDGMQRELWHWAQTRGASGVYTWPDLPRASEVRA